MTTVPNEPLPTAPARRDWLLATGMTLVGLAAAASSFSGLFDLARRTGWLLWLCALLPLTVDAYAMTATRVWLAKSTCNAYARRWAKANAIGAITVSVAGNAVDHAVAAGVFRMVWPLVVAVSAIPPIVLGLLVHMAHLRHLPPAGEAAPTADTGSTPAASERQPADNGSAAAPLPPPVAAPAEPAPPKTEQRPRRAVGGSKQRRALPSGRTDAELIAAARERLAVGQEPSATWLVKTFGIGTGRAARIRDTALLSAQDGPGLTSVPDPAPRPDASGPDVPAAEADDGPAEPHDDTDHTDDDTDQESAA